MLSFVSRWYCRDTEKRNPCPNSGYCVYHCYYYCCCSHMLWVCVRQMVLALPRAPVPQGPPNPDLGPETTFLQTPHASGPMPTTTPTPNIHPPTSFGSPTPTVIEPWLASILTRLLPGFPMNGQALPWKIQQTSLSSNGFNRTFSDKV